MGLSPCLFTAGSYALIMAAILGFPLPRAGGRPSPPVRPPSLSWWSSMEQPTSTMTGPEKAGHGHPGLCALLCGDPHVEAHHSQPEKQRGPECPEEACWETDCIVRLELDDGFILGNVLVVEICELFSSNYKSTLSIHSVS